MSEPMTARRQRSDPEFSPLETADCHTRAIAETIVERVLRQALEASLFEGVIDYVLVPVAGKLWGTLYFSLGDVDYRCEGRLRGFGRVRLNVASLARVHSAPSFVVTEDVITQWLNALPGDASTRRRIEQELKQTLHWSEWNQQHLPPCGDRSALSLPQLEMAMDEGHPYHPCFKARIGFTEDDHRRYSPESASPVRPHWIAVPRERVVASGKARESEVFWRSELGDAGYETLRARARVRGLDPNAMFYVPVHPWQWQKHLAARCQSARVRVVDLGQPGDDYWVSQSVRTLMNRARPHKADLKLPLNIVNTSATRYLLSHGIESGPRLSRWIADTVAADDFFLQYPLVILREYAGLRVETLFPDGDPEHCELGALWRESLASRQKQEEAAVPLMALALIEANGQPFIDAWVRRYGLETWLRQLFNTLVLPVWHLLAHHGIGLEAHGQNTVLLHEHGWPMRLAARDFHESVEYVESFLAHPERAPAFSRETRYAHAQANEYYWMTSVEALRELAMDTLFVFHLSELALVCEEHYQLPEGHFWALIDDCLENYRQSGHCAPERLDALGYRAPMIQVESLLRKKLCPSSNEYHHRVPNPFAQPYQEVSHAVLPQ